MEMNKREFLVQLRKGLSGLPQDDIEERLSFYSEMIDDQMEEGFSEEQAVAAAGPVDEIVKQAVAETPFVKIAKKRIKPKKRLGVGKTLLLVLGSPIWLSLGLAAFAVVLSLYAVLWAVIICLWAIFVSLGACAVGGVLMSIVQAICGNGETALVMLAASIVCFGLTVFAFYGCKAATKGCFMLTREIAICVKRCFIKKEEA